MCSQSIYVEQVVSVENSMLKHPDLYMMLTVINYLMILSALFEMQFYTLRKAILDDFVWIKGIPFV